MLCYSIYSIYSTPRTPLYDSTLTVGAQSFFGEADFFSAKRRAKPAIGDGVLWATPCKRRRSLKRSLEKAKPRAMSLGGSVVANPHQIPTKSPPNPSSIHQVESIQSVGSVGSIASIHPGNSNIPYWYCPHCTPSLTLPPSSLKCLQKSNPNIHTKCFRCFKCFGCFRCFRCNYSAMQ